MSLWISSPDIRQVCFDRIPRILARVENLLARGILGGKHVRAPWDHWFNDPEYINVGRKIAKLRKRISGIDGWEEERKYQKANEQWEQILLIYCNEEPKGRGRAPKRREIPKERISISELARRKREACVLQVQSLKEDQKAYEARKRVEREEKRREKRREDKKVQEEIEELSRGIQAINEERRRKAKQFFKELPEAKQLFKKKKKKKKGETSPVEPEGKE